MSKALREATSTLLAKYRPLRVADILGINHTHIYKARKGEYTRTYRRALREHGYLPPRKVYPYFKIRSDSPERAARQVVRSLGQGYAALLADELLRHVDYDQLYRWAHGDLLALADRHYGSAGRPAREGAGAAPQIFVDDDGG